MLPAARVEVEVEAGTRAFPLLGALGRCPVCEADALVALQEHRNKHFLTTAPSLLLVGCQVCGVVHSAPLPTEEELDRYYGDAEGWDSRIAAYEDLESEDPDRKLKIKRKHYETEFRLIERFLPQPQADKRPRVLDFGCGVGAYLDVLTARGWDTYGLEPGRAARDLAGQRHHMLDEVPSTEDFDLVIVNHVLEHVRDPLAITRSLARALRIGGRIFVSSPNLGRLAEHQKIHYVRSDYHIFSYTRSGMASLLGLAGLEMVPAKDGPDWDRLGEAAVRRLKCLATRVGDVRTPSGRPLEEAIENLLAYGAQLERKGAQEGSKPPTAAESRSDQSLHVQSEAVPPGGAVGTTSVDS